MSRIAYIKWVDSTDHGAIHKDDKSPKRDYIESAGHIVYQDENEIQLALHFNWKPDHYTETITIPKEAIKKVRRFKID